MMRKKKIYQLYLGVLCTACVVIYLMVHHLSKLDPKKTIYCYHNTSNSLEDITESNPKRGKSIFFLETSCRSHIEGKIVISTRQACAIESAAKMNPNFDIYVLYVSPGRLMLEDSLSDKLLAILLNYENVHFKHINYEKFTTGTLVQDVTRSGKLEQSIYQVSHASDILRFLTLLKYGGIYLDLDVVVMKTFENLTLNFAGDEGLNSINSCVLAFDNTDYGRKLLKMCLEDVNKNYDGKIWGNNGPGVITRLLKNICNTTDTKDMTLERCNGFMVYPEYAFYPVHWSKFYEYFLEEYMYKVDEWMRNSYTIHLFSHVSDKWQVRVGSNVPYARIAEKFCPKVYSNCGVYF